MTATTSLKEQLQKLRAPQTNLLQDAKKRPSFMFDADKAATITRATFYEIGKSGLGELISLDKRFEKFANTLFNETTLYFQRTVETKIVNEELDEQIKDLFYHLIPYFSIRPAHCVLEWLIVRYNVHSFNTDDFLFFLLPYYHTKLFARALQVIDIKTHASRWSWLYKVRKECIPLDRITLFTRCATDAFLLKMICRKTEEAVQVSNSPTLINFYTSCLVGVIQTAFPLEDIHVSHMLPSLIRALESGVRPLTLAAFVVLNFMMAKTSLDPKVVKCIVKTMLKVKLNVHEEQTLFLLSVYQKYPGLVLPPLALKTLAKKDWFIKNLMKISQDPDMYDILPLCFQVIKQCIDYVNDHQRAGISDDDAEMLKKVKLLGMHVLLNIKFEDEEVSQILEMIKDSASVETKSNKEVDMDGLVKYASRLVQTLESQYPNAWDGFIYKYTTEGDDGLSEVQRRVLALNIEHSSHAEVYMKLTDSKALIRAETVKYLAAHAAPGEVRESIRHVIGQLWRDDEPCVVDALLQLPESLWCLNIDEIVSTVVHLYQQTISRKPWEVTTQRALVKFLDSDLCLNANGQHRSNLILAVLPFLFYNKNFLETVLHTKFSEKDTLLKLMKSAFTKTSCESIAWDALVKKPTCESLPPTDHIVNSLSKDIYFRKPIYVTFSCIILAANITPQDSPEDLLKLFKFVSQFFESKNVQGKFYSELSFETLGMSLSVCHKGKLPLIIYSHFMQGFISKLKMSDNSDSMWTYCTTTPLSSLLVEMFCTFVNKCNQFEKNGLRAHLKIHVSIMQCFINQFIPDVKDQIKFYCNLSLNTNSDVNLTIWCLYMLHRLVQKNQISMDSAFVSYFIVLLYSPNEVVRKLSLDVLQCFANTFQGVLKGEKGEKDFTNFIKDLMKFRDEIYLDNQCVITYMEILSDRAYRNVLDNLLSSMVHEDTPPHVTMQLLQVLANVHSCHIFSQLIPLTRQILSTIEEEETFKIIQDPQSTILFHILKRFSHNTSEILDEASCWNCIEECVRNFKVKLSLNGETYLCANVVFDNIKADIYDGLSRVGQERILRLLFEIKHETDNDDILICIKDFVKKISLDCKLIEHFLKNMAMATGEMKNEIEPLRKRRMVELPSVELLNTKEWKLGIATLESIEHKKKLDNAQVMLPHMFQILKKCLQFDEQMYVEYMKQLCLTSIHNCVLKVEKIEALPVNAIDIDAIVDSIRTSKNPQTHHQALLLLSYIASILPDQVLKKFMPIFTFIGNSILRLDDAYSLQIINKVIENVVPVILTTSENKSKNSFDTTEANVVDVLRVFTDAIMDIPDHRRIYLMEKLLTTLYNGHYLYVFLQLMFERHVLHPESALEVNTVKRYNKDLKAQHAGGMPKRLKLALHVCSKYPLNIIIESCFKLVQFLQLMPLEKDDRFSNEEARKRVQRIIRVDKITAKQFRHYKYTLLMFTSSLLSSHNTVALISKNNDYELGHVSKLNLDDMLKNTIEEILKYTQVVTKQVDVSSAQSKYWAGMLSQCYDILDKINALIDSAVFVNVIKKLLKHKTLSLRKRCLDMLNWRLQQKHNFAHQDLLKLVKPLVGLAVNTEQINTIEAQLNQQTALISLKLFVRNLGNEHIEMFVDILNQLMEVFEKQHEPPVIASLVLCIAEMCSVLKAHTLTVLPTFMPKLVSCLCDYKSCDVITLAVISSLLKVVDHLSMFMSPYLVDILGEVCILDTAPWTDSSKAVAIRTKLGYLKTKLANDIPARVLVSSISSCFSRLVASENYQATTTLLSILGDSFSSAGFLYNSEVTDFFLGALNFRVSQSGCDVTEDSVCIVETSVICAFVKLILKLSESNFKPLFNKLYDWAFRSESKAQKNRVITFFILTSHVAEALKSLFVLFAGTIVKDCAVILDKTQLGKHAELYLPEEKKNSVLLDAVLATLLSIFTHDVHQFITKERFKLLMQHLVDQLENKLPGYESRCRRLVQPCIVQFAASSNDDLQWKSVNYEILLKTRDNDSYVRLMSLECVLLLATKLGDNFLPLLPETVPFLAELLEDENEHVEKACHKVVQEMEQLLGEPISKYF